MRLTWVVVLFTSLWLVEGVHKPQWACAGWASVTEPCLEVCIKCTCLDKVPPRHCVCFFITAAPITTIMWSSVLWRSHYRRRWGFWRLKRSNLYFIFHVMHRWYKLTLMMLTVLTAHLCITGTMSCHSTYCSWFRRSSMRLTLTVPLWSSSWRVPSKISIWDTNSSGFWGTNLLVISNSYFKKKNLSFFKGTILLKELPFLLTLSNCVGCRLPTLSLTVGAVSEAGFRRMFATLHNMRNARDTNQAVNISLSIFLCGPFLELLMQKFGPVLWHFFHHMCDWCTFFKTKCQHPGEGAIWTSLAHWEYTITWLSVQFLVYLHWKHFWCKTY